MDRKERAKSILEWLKYKILRTEELRQNEGWERQYRERVAHRAAVNEFEEEKLYKKFVEKAEYKKRKQEEIDKESMRKIKAGEELTAEDKKKVNKFELTDVDELGIDYDVLFISSKKGIGKTWTIKKLMAQCEEEERDMIYLRQTRLAAESNIKQELNTCPTWPFKVEGNTPMKLVSKNCTVKVPKGKKPVERGYIGYLSGASSMYGQSYANVKYIVFDECMAHKQNDITPQDMEEWQKMLSSIIRDKRDCKVYMFGNFLEMEDDCVDQPFMEEYGLSWKDNLKIIEAEVKGQVYRLLYINCGDLYEGVESQGIIHLSANRDFIKSLESNKLDPEAPNIIPLDAYLGMDQEFNLIFRGKENERRALEVRSIETEMLISDGEIKEKVKRRHLACRITKFIPERHNYRSYTASQTIAGSFDFITYMKKERIMKYWKYVEKNVLRGNMLFGNCSTYSELDTWFDKFIEEIENSGSI